MGKHEPSTASRTVEAVPEFSVVWRGYDRDEVTQYLRTIGERIGTLERTLKAVERELDEARMQERALKESNARDQYDVAFRRLADVVREVDEHIETIRRQAEAEAERVVSDARIEAGEVLAETKRQAESLLLDAERKAEELRNSAETVLSDARAKVEEDLRDLTSRRELMIGEMRAFHARLLDAARALERPTGDDGEDRPIRIEVPDVADAREGG
jgi:cell division septum initiation protein DivIVA